MESVLRYATPARHGVLFIRRRLRESATYSEAPDGIGLDIYKKVITLNRMHLIDFRLCQFGDSLPADAFSPPDSPSHGPTLQVWTYHGAQHVNDCVELYFERTAEGEPWVRKMSEREIYLLDYENDNLMEVTREMAIDAGDRRLEGQTIRW